MRTFYWLRRKEENRFIEVGKRRKPQTEIPKANLIVEIISIVLQRSQRASRALLNLHQKKLSL